MTGKQNSVSLPKTYQNAIDSRRVQPGPDKYETCSYFHQQKQSITISKAPRDLSVKAT